MEKFAVIDTETNWENQVMSIGVVIAQAESCKIVDGRYYILTPEYQVGGIYAQALGLKGKVHPVVCSRKQAVNQLLAWFRCHKVSSLFAYNAAFDRRHLPEFSSLDWYDIMRLAAYRQYNPRIPDDADCFCTGRLKRAYGVEPMLRLLSGRDTYRETHNAYLDALDELEIMQLLGHRLCEYIPL